MWNLALASVLLLASSCKKASTPKPSTDAAQSNRPVVPPPALLATGPPPVTVTNTRPGGLLKVKWPVGARYVYRLELEQHSTNQFSEQPAPIVEHVAMGISYSLTVRNQNTNTGTNLELEFLAYELEMKEADKIALAYDSAPGATNQGPKDLGDSFRKLIGSKVQLEIDAQGKSGRAVDLEAWRKTLASDPPGPAQEILAQQFHEGFFQQITDFGKALPDKPVYVGDSWPYRVEVPAGALGTIAADSTITLARWQKTERDLFAVLETKGTLQGKPNPESPALLALDQGTVRGTSWFDPELGALVESAVEQSMRLRAQPPPTSDTNAPPQNFTSELSQRVSLKLVEVVKP